MVFSDFLNPIFGPLLNIPAVYGLVILSFLISLIIVVIYKYTTDQSLMKSLKDETKELQVQMKTLKHDPEKMMQVQKRAMEVNMKYMWQSMRSTIFTFIPIIIIFGWLQAHFAYDPLLPNQEFSVEVLLEKGIEGTVNLSATEGIIITSNSSKEITNGNAIFTMKGDPGLYDLQFSVDGKEYAKDILITNEMKYSPVQKIIKDKTVNTIKVDNQPKRVLNLFGWKLGWLGTYIIFSILFSIVLRKLLKVY